MPSKIRLKVSLGIGIAVLAALATVHMLRQSRMWADASCVESVFQTLIHQPELLSKVEIPVANTWCELDTLASSEIIGRLHALGLLDCKGIDNALKNNRLGSFMSIQVNSGSNGAFRLRVIGAGRDRQMGTSDDKILESAEIKLRTNGIGQVTR